MSLTRRTPLKRKTPLKRTGFKKPIFAKNEDAKPRKPMRKNTPKRAKEMRDYAAISKEFLAANPWCGICNARGFLYANQAVEIHHRRGRNAALLCDTRFFMASCRDCREWPHENPREAREKGVLASAAEWNLSPI